MIYILDRYFSNFNVQTNYLEILLKADSNPIGLRRGPEVLDLKRVPRQRPCLSAGHC